MERLESLDMLFKKEASAEIARYDRACDILTSNLDRLKSELQGGDRADALSSLERLLKEAKEAQEALSVKRAAFKEARGL